MNDEFSNNTESQESKSINDQLYGENNSQQESGNTPPPAYTPQPPYQNMVPPEEKKATNGYAIAGLVCGIVSLVCCCIGYSFIVGIVGIVLSVMGLKNSPPNQKTMAMFGLILSIVGTVFGIIILILSFSSIFEMNEYWDSYQNGGSPSFEEIWGE